MPTIKLFTVDEAERTLPLVRRIVGDIVNSFEEREKRRVRRQGMETIKTAELRELAERLENEMAYYEDEIRRFHEELQLIGVELKDFRAGLIDFFSRYEDRIVHLCWKLDEGDTLAYWHDLHAGFRGRQAITPLNRARFKGLKPGEKSVTLNL